MSLLFDSLSQVLLRYSEIPKTDVPTPDQSFPLIPTAPGHGLILRSVTFVPHPSDAPPTKPHHSLGYLKLLGQQFSENPLSRREQTTMDNNFSSLLGFKNSAEGRSVDFRQIDLPTDIQKDPHIQEWLADREALPVTSTTRPPQLSSSIISDFENQLIRQIASIELRERNFEHWVCELHQTLPMRNKSCHEQMILMGQKQHHCRSSQHHNYQDVTDDSTHESIKEGGTDPERFDDLMELKVSDKDFSAKGDGRLENSINSVSCCDAPEFYLMDELDEIEAPGLEVFNIASPCNDASYSDDDSQNFQCPNNDQSLNIPSEEDGDIEGEHRHSSTSQLLHQLEFHSLKLHGWSSVLLNASQLLVKIQQHDTKRSAANS